MMNGKHWGVPRWGFLIFGILNLLAALVFPFFPDTRQTLTGTVLTLGVATFFISIAIGASDDVFNKAYLILWKRKWPW
jgi:predicted Na+-dependent transporter